VKPYRCDATSIDGFVQQLAAGYVARGYFFFVTGVIPEGKDPAQVDGKLISLYGIDCSKWERASRKAARLANMQYLRHERFFVLLATHGRHPFFEREAGRLRDCRKSPIRYAGYAVSSKLGGDGKRHASVRVEKRQYVELKAFFLEMATRWPAERLEVELRALPFRPYAPVRRQLLCILRHVNYRRLFASLPPISAACFDFRKRPVRPFD
jgi:hypothetical protein